jgi:hypothetical protein
MFAVGQLVYHRAGKHSGTILEIDGDTVYLEQSKGAEIDFPISEVMAAPPAERRPVVAAVVAVAGSTAAPVRMLTMNDITDEHRKVLAIIPPRTMQAVAQLFERRPNAARFSGLDVAMKLNFIAGVSGVPYRTMKEFSDRPGELGLMMARGLSSSSGPIR